MEGKAGSSRLLWRTYEVVCGVRLTSFGPGIVSENSVISEKKQPFMMDFSSSGFTNQRALRRVIGAIAVSGVIA
jgi:hypothetical protein